jgi:hypothetical protein
MELRFPGLAAGADDDVVCPEDEPGIVIAARFWI